MLKTPSETYIEMNMPGGVIILKKYGIELAMACLLLLSFYILSREAAQTAGNMSRSESSQVILVDAGHGGADPGMIGVGGLEEKGINLEIALKLKKVLEEIIATPTGNDFVTFEITNIAPIAVAKKYAGIGASLVARIKNTKTPFSIDFGVGDVIVPNQEKRKIPTQLTDFAAPMVNTYSLEMAKNSVKSLYFRLSLNREYQIEKRLHDGEDNFQ